MTYSHETPTPGSKEAINLGCSCPVEDNHKGKGIPSATGMLFWMESSCPLHGKNDVAPSKWSKYFWQCYTCAHHMIESEPDIRRFETFCMCEDITEEDLAADICPKHKDIPDPYD